MILDRVAIEATVRQQEEQELSFEEEQSLAGAVEDTDEPVKPSRAEIPEEFRPRSSRVDGEIPSGPGLGPVRIRYVHIDSTGKIYLVSAETGKIYVYSPEEEFLFAFGEKGGTPRKLASPTPWISTRRVG
jgi:hypothetical protein